MFGDDLVEAVEAVETLTEERMDYRKLQNELTYLKSNINDLEQGNWIVTEKKLHAQALKRAQGIVKMIKAGAPKKKSFGEAASETELKYGMYYQWLRKVHDQLSEAYPNLSQWEKTKEERATTQVLRKALIAVKRTLKG